jgi:hypothetical protein
MIVGTRGSWQTVMADLALILFIVAAAALNRHGVHKQDAALPVRTQPLAIFRPNDGAPSLREWLAEQPQDDREHLTIVGRYSDGHIASVSKGAADLAFEAEAAGRPARVVLEPAVRPDLMAMLAFDGAGDWHGDCNATESQDASSVTAKDVSCE